MEVEFAGIERRLDERNERLARLWPLKEKTQAEFDEDASLFADRVRVWLRQRSTES
jgi:hypothetical protein